MTEENLTFKANMDFWLHKRGQNPFVTFKGGGMKAVVNLEIPLDEIADFYGIDKLDINGVHWYRTGKAPEVAG
jgi:hypothetical protein